MEWYEIITLSDYGWLAQLVPLVLVLFASWALSTKSRDILLVQFPLMLGMKMIFPFFDPSWVYMSLALLLLYFYSAKDNFISDIKNIATPHRVKIDKEIVKGYLKESRANQVRKKINELLKGDQ